MHGIRSEPGRDGIRAHDLRRLRQSHAILGQAPRGVLGGKEAPDMALRIFQGGLDGVPAEKNDRAVGHGRISCACGPRPIRPCNIRTHNIRPHLWPGSGPWFSTIGRFPWPPRFEIPFAHGLPLMRRGPIRQHVYVPAGLLVGMYAR